MRALLQPLGKPFDLQAWRTHITTKKHRNAAALRSKLPPATPKVTVLEYGTSQSVACGASGAVVRSGVSAARSLCRGGRAVKLSSPAAREKYD